MDKQYIVTVTIGLKLKYYGFYSEKTRDQFLVRCQNLGLSYSYTVNKVSMNIPVRKVG